MPKVKRALVSVHDKTGVVDFCRALSRLGVQILSTGGTASLLRGKDVPVVEVAEYTGFPEIMDGRVKTLHPKIHGGLLGRRGQDDAVMQAHGIEPIDLLIVNLYPFEQTVARPGCTRAEAIENIDIGGPAMIRAAAKNHACVGVVVDPADYSGVLRELEQNGLELREETLAVLAEKAFARTARYDGDIANYLGADGGRDGFPRNFTLQFAKLLDLRYGENPHQSAAFYREPAPPAGSLAAARRLQGKELSFNNIADADAALECALSFAEPACVIVKHANPCGVAEAATAKDAYEAAYATDPVSAFGGVIAWNRTVDEAAAQAVVGRQFVEVMVAPDFAPAALAAIAAKPDVRVLAAGSRAAPLRQLDIKRVSGGLLVQDADAGTAAPESLRVVTRRSPSAEQLADLLFAWRVVKFVKSNAIVYASGRRTLGVGAGQMSRIHSARIAALKAAESGLDLRGCGMASDAFFPFRDGIDAAAAAGVAAVIQPGGSVRDKEVIAAADEHGMAMVFTGMRHFRH
jgi:phosphoribosylaminoimidazolecarboxamide formyltransferase/IMP cyclohydrolase